MWSSKTGGLLQQLSFKTGSTVQTVDYHNRWGWNTDINLGTLIHKKLDIKLNLKQSYKPEIMSLLSFYFYIKIV